MTLSSIPTIAEESTGGSVSVDGDTVTIRDLTLVHGEAAAVLTDQAESAGPGSMTDLVARALPVGLVALAMGRAVVDTGAIQRTLDGFATAVDERSRAALMALEQTSSRLADGETNVVATAQRILQALPTQLESVLGGEAGHVRAAVAEAARAAQAAGLQELQGALRLHSEAVRAALSLDGEGPIQALRRDLVQHVDSGRREIGEQLAALRGLLQADQAVTAASARNSRAIGAVWESAAMSIANDVITAAGDLFQAVGNTPAPGGTARAGDGLATMSAALTGRRDVKIVIEAKRRSRPLTARQFHDELTAARNVREAAAALAIVPSPAEVPGGGRFCRVDDLAYVVAGDDPSLVGLVYLVLRELVVVMHCRRDGADPVDLAGVETQLNVALAALADLDQIARLTGDAQKNLARLIEVGRGVKTRLQAALTTAVSALHP